MLGNASVLYPNVERLIIWVVNRRDQRYNCCHPSYYYYELKNNDERAQLFLALADLWRIWSKTRRFGEVGTHLVQMNPYPSHTRVAPCNDLFLMTTTNRHTHKRKVRLKTLISIVRTDRNRMLERPYPYVHLIVRHIQFDLKTLFFSRISKFFLYAL